MVISHVTDRRKTAPWHLSCHSVDGSNKVHVCMSLCEHDECVCIIATLLNVQKQQPWVLVQTLLLTLGPIPACTGLHALKKTEKKTCFSHTLALNFHILEKHHVLCSLLRVYVRVCVCVLFTFLCYQWIRHLRSTLGLVGNSYLIVRKIPGTYLLMRCCLACCFYLLAVWCVISSVNSHFLLIVSMYTVLMCDLSVSRKRYRLSNILL